MNMLNSICTALTLVFALALLVLLAQVFYVLWRRRRFRGRSLSSPSGVEFSANSFYSTPSKELLYFFCWKNQANRIEPHAAAPTAPPLPLPPPPTDSEVEEMLKLPGLYGPSRVLFTIREEEREEMEAETLSSAVPTEARKQPSRSDFSEEKRAADVLTVAIEISQTTPFSTPCASPPYYTPSPSPPRNGSYFSDDEFYHIVLGNEEGMRREQPRTRHVSDAKAVASVSIEVPHDT